MRIAGVSCFAFRFFFALPFALALMSACGEDVDPGTGTDASPVPGQHPTPSPAETPEQAGRPVLPAPDRTWTGRPATLICVEDLSDTFSQGALASQLRPLLTSVLDPISSVPVIVAEGCPFDFLEGAIVSHESVNLFTYQVYVSDKLTEPRAEALEHWLPPGTDSATPVTFRLEIPLSATADPTLLAWWLQSHLAPEPFSTRR
jgi:hypothetical protein